MKRTAQQAWQFRIISAPLTQVSDFSRGIRRHTVGLARFAGLLHRLYDAATLNEEVTGDRKRQPYYWEARSGAQTP